MFLVVSHLVPTFLLVHPEEMSATGDESVLGSTATSPTEQGGGGAGTAASRRRGLATTTTPPVLLPTALATAAVVPSHSHGNHDAGSGAPPPTRLLRPRTKTTSPTITPHRAFAIHVCGGRCCRGTWLGLRCWGCFGPYRLRPWSMVRSWQDAFDLAFDAVGWVVERAVYGLGPILIVLALSIAGLLTHTFATILIPMWQDKYRNASVYLLVAVVCAHGAIVATLLGNVLFNYYYCVITPHSGPTFDATVRALATATGVVYPETPTEVEAFRHEFEDKMVLRMRRRHARSLEQQQRQQQQMQPPSLPAAGLAPPVPPSSEPQQHAAGVVPAPLPNGTAAAPGGGPSTDTAAAPPPLRATPTALPSKPPPPPPPATLPLRGWMLLGPYEWGYCGHSHQPKPPRSHYDHVSKQLVLNLDHYCPWMFNSSTFVGCVCCPVVGCPPNLLPALGCTTTVSARRPATIHRSPLEPFHFRQSGTSTTVTLSTFSFTSFLGCSTVRPTGFCSLDVAETKMTSARAHFTVVATARFAFHPLCYSLHRSTRHGGTLPVAGHSRVQAAIPPGSATARCSPRRNAFHTCAVGPVTPTPSRSDAPLCTRADAPVPQLYAVCGSRIGRIVVGRLSCVPRMHRPNHH